MGVFITLNAVECFRTLVNLAQTTRITASKEKSRTAHAVMDGCIILTGAY
jgi:hypothetical protein